VQPRDVGPVSSTHAAGRSVAGRNRVLREFTPREHEVAALIAQGLTNSQIAQRLVIATGTVANHVAHILAKLEVSSRVHVAVTYATCTADRGAQERPLQVHRVAGLNWLNEEPPQNAIDHFYLAERSYLVEQELERLADLLRRIAQIATTPDCAACTSVSDLCREGLDVGTPPNRRSVLSIQAMTVGSVLSPIGRMTRKRLQASQAHHNHVLRPSTSGPSA
jgi:DNA-binding CsgD family transcriptional regulator